MAEEIVTGRQDGVSDDALAAATGKTWAEWFAILDAEGAAAWKHSAIARWLDAHYPLGGWWAQGVTVGYEQARGIRLPGQRQDGSFEASVSKTLPLEQLPALDAVVAALAEELGAPASESRAAKYVTARWAMPVGSLLATIAPSKGGKSSAGLTWQRLGGAEDVAPAKARMQGWLQAAAELG
ncbi:DUF4287 domain-containing protein [Microterricola viridarii]|uniref:DUF4287 domain-containing protein n=1 Tax=Microterricola viridarii TaxID=412690 RepID=A0A109QX52_9MICO|nr:DUF4287 domain-containing protein [Microterricola viridarii]AMB59119.1 hypothetical protein AWU67_09905 [Microterricola viridarii]